MLIMLPLLSSPSFFFGIPTWKECREQLCSKEAAGAEQKCYGREALALAFVREFQPLSGLSSRNFRTTAIEAMTLLRSGIPAAVDFEY